MGLLTDMFIATEAELAALLPGQGGPARFFPSVQCKGVEQVKLARLEALLTGQEYETVIGAMGGRPVQDWGEEFVYRIPESFVTTLARLDPSHSEGYAAEWAGTAEWQLDGIRPAAYGSLARLINDYRQLAERAQNERKAMFLWISL